MKKSFYIRHAILLYFMLAYAISWGIIFMILSTNGLHIYKGDSVLSKTVSSQILYVWLAMLAGPSIAGISLTALGDGKDSLKILANDIFKWKVKFKWYAAALFIFPAVIVAILYSFTFFSLDYSPGFMIATGIGAGLIGGFFEEIGWTGFALPKLQLKYSPLKAGIILGVVHTFWHLPADAWGGINLYQNLYILHFFLWVLALTAFRLIAVWIYNNSKSVLLASLTHASFTGSQLIFSPSALNKRESIVWYAIFTIMLWIVVLVIIKKDKFQWTKSNLTPFIKS
jgi:uncharacterized protein